MTSSYHSKVRSTQSKGVTFLFGTWNCIIIFSRLGKGKVSTVNSDLTNFVHVQCLHEKIKWFMYFYQGLAIICLQKRYCSSFLKRFIYRRVNISKILRSATIPIIITKNQVKTISVHFIKKKLPSSQVIYCLPTRKI